MDLVMAITSRESFLEILQASELLTEERFARARDMSGQDDDAQALADALVKEELLTGWQAGQLLSGRSSFRLGKYELIELLGRGGMGSVYLARHTTMNRQVALKIISRKLGKEPAVLEQFLSEARAIAALDHPNIVHAYNVDSEGESYFIAMEFVEGRDLQRTVEVDGPLDYKLAIDYIRQAAEGLAHAHGRDMIHCDVKPANLLVNPDGIVKILDMGLARLLGSPTEGSGESKLALGTVDYMAPEQALDSPELDHRVDIYSLGCTFYFLLVGRAPFGEGTLHERILKHQMHQPRSIVAQRPGTPVDLAEICRKMMAKEPGARYQTAGEISRLFTDWRPSKRRLPRAVPLAEPDEAPPAPEPDVPANEGTALLDMAMGLDALPEAPGRPEPKADESEESSPGPWRRLLLWGAVAGFGLIVLVGVAVLFVLSRPEPTAERTPPGAVVEEGQSGAGEVRRSQTPIDRVGASSEMAMPADDDVETVSKPPADAVTGPEEPPEPTGPRQDSSGPGSEPSASENTPSTEPPNQSGPPEWAGKAPFEDLADAIDLPQVNGSADLTGPQVLGKIYTDPSVRWQLFLQGGDTALKRPRQMMRKFVLRQTERDPAIASWSVQLEESSSGTGRKTTDIAVIGRNDVALVFRWAEDAEPASANYLRNCVLKIRVDNESRYLALLRPKRLEPIPIDLARSASVRLISLDWLAQTDSLRLAAVRLEGFEPYTLEPAEPAALAPVRVLVDRKDRNGNTRPAVELEVALTARLPRVTTSVRVLESPTIPFRQKRSPATLFKSFVPPKLAGRKNAIDRERQRLERVLNPDDNVRAPRSSRRRALNEQLDGLSAEQWYIEFYEQVHQKARLHFQLFVEVDGRDVLLATTGPPEESGQGSGGLPVN